MFEVKQIPGLIFALLTGALLASYFDNREDVQEVKALIAGDSGVSDEAVSAQYTNAAILKREYDGHFRARADVNGLEVKFLIDTGASTVALTLDDAERLGFDPDELDFRWSINTAGGETKGASVLIRSIRIGQVEVRDIRAMVMDHDLEESLLGMTFLSELYSYEFRKRNLIIRQ